MPQRYDMVVRQQQEAALARGYSAPTSGLPSETPEPSILKPILRQWWIVLLFGLIGVGAALVYISRVQPLYTSFAKLYIQPTANSVIEALGTAERGSYLATQVDKITSTPVLKRFADDPDFQRMKTFSHADGRIVEYLQGELEVTLERRTDLIDVEFTSPFADEACQVVKAVCEAYISDATEIKDKQTEDVMSTLKIAQAAAEKQISDLTDEKKQFLLKHPLAMGSANQDFSGVDAENLKSVQTRMTNIELDLITNKAVLGANNPTIKRLETSLAGMKMMCADLMEKLSRHNAENFELQEINNRILEAKVLRDTCASRIQKIELETSGHKLIDIDIHEPARVPDSPSYPRKKRTLAVAVVAGMLVGAGLALLRDRLDGRLRSIEEIQTVIGLPILGVVPGMGGRRTAVARAMAVHLDPRSPVAEAYRTIRTAVYFGVDGSRCKTILVTSPEPGDGKTTSASNLAIAIAQTGRSVLLLDADFRKPSQHKNLELNDAIGLSSVLAGQEPLERAIQHTGVEGLDILPCGPIPANPSEILNSREFGELVDALARRYDHIMFDSPPVNAVTDARILGAVCDATILVLRADKSTRKSGEHARNALLAVGTRILGAVVNDAPRKRGYEVYGGSYYGRGESSSPQRLPPQPDLPTDLNDIA